MDRGWYRRVKTGLSKLETAEGRLTGPRCISFIMGLYRQKYLRWNCQKCETHRYEFDEFNIEEPTRCNNNNLSISKISLTCFGQTFAHLQERKTEIFIAYGIVTCCFGRQGFGKRQRGTLPLSKTLPTTTTGHYTICCKNLSLTLLKMGKRLPETC